MKNNKIKAEESAAKEKTKKSPEFKSAKKEISNLEVRALSTIVLLTLLLIYVISGAIYTSLINSWSGAPYFVIISLLGSIFLISISIWEMNRALGIKDWWMHLITVVIALLLFATPVRSEEFLLTISQSSLKFMTDLHFDWLKFWIFWVLGFVFLMVYLSYGFWKKNTSLVKMLLAFAMSLVIVLAYKGFTVLCLSVIETGLGQYKAFYSFNTVIWIWMIIILTDTFAYLGGMKFGKTKLAPSISPKKTWEGATIGFVVAFIIGALYALMFYFVEPIRDFAPLTITMQQNGSTVYIVFSYIGLSAVFSIIGQFGDLLFSWIKRKVDVKDYSRIIPGHGGVLDRLDSFTFAFFVVFFITIYIR
ncbi:phosphatidate cytidylyltransferase [Spiroplasma alleghenense]|uniref:Phosphatidate cytidylyltransferase n=1 Tax=Spiroplasma alleghenense TaxID=216931 RepID=A0A345Z3U2_9MOLU|nr:phosphatidate cytidylyltransferase [Spiroplasma alleghenense]AXK51271.1 phosphatidate cytidylyltransferase [Spiroplasma alleghenense]